MDNQTLGFIVLGMAALYTMSPSQDNNPTQENVYHVPGVGDVVESKLPDLGYVKFNGKWFKISDIQAAAASNGVTQPGNVDISTQQGFNIFMTLLTTGAGIATTIINNTAQRKADLIEQITTKYTLTVSTSYDPNFPYTEAQLKALTIPKLEKILTGDFSVSGVALEKDLFHKNRCLDGRYSSSHGKGTCSYHGGIGSTKKRSWTQNL